MWLTKPKSKKNYPERFPHANILAHALLRQNLFHEPVIPIVWRGFEAEYGAVSSSHRRKLRFIAQHDEFFRRDGKQGVSATILAALHHSTACQS